MAGECRSRNGGLGSRWLRWSPAAAASTWVAAPKQPATRGAPPHHARELLAIVADLWEVLCPCPLGSDALGPIVGTSILASDAGAPWP